MAKQTVIPTGTQRVLREDDFIVSKTDPKGVITYGNQTFIEFSGCSEAELLGYFSVRRKPRKEAMRI